MTTKTLVGTRGEFDIFNVFEVVAGRTVKVATSLDPRPGTPSHNRSIIRQRIADALAVNATYLARVNPTAAQNTAQIQKLTRECNALIRLFLGQTETLDGT